MKTVTFTEFRKNALSLFNEVENGETITIVRHGKIIAEISPPEIDDFEKPAWKKTGSEIDIKRRKSLEQNHR